MSKNVVGKSGYSVSSKLILKVRNAPPPYEKVVHAIQHKATVVYGNSESWGAFEKWLASRPVGRVFVMRGPSGVGKTHATMLFAKNMNYDVVEFSASSGHSADVMATLLRESSLRYRGAADRRRLILVELDSMPEEKQLVVLSHVRSMTGRFAPLVCTCNDFASAIVRELAGLAQHSVILWAVSELELAKYAEHYYPTQHPVSIRAAVAFANGDIRQLDMRLRVSDAAKPDPMCDLFRLGRAVITRRSPSRWLLDASRNANSRMVLYLAHENYTSAVPSVEAMACAADLYSVAECMESFSVIGALAETVAVLGASGPSLVPELYSGAGWSTAPCATKKTGAQVRGYSPGDAWGMADHMKIRWPELLRARKSITCEKVGQV